MEHLGDVGHVESCSGPFGDSVSIGARLVQGLRQTYHRLGKSFWIHPMILLGDVAQVEAHFLPFRDSDNLDVDRCTFVPNVP
jgi:hypothetical protein